MKFYIIIYGSLIALMYIFCLTKIELLTQTLWVNRQLYKYKKLIGHKLKHYTINMIYHNVNLYL